MLLALENNLKEWKIANSKLAPNKWFEDKGAVESKYTMTQEEKDVRAMVVRHFTLGDITMQMPRVEFNDMSVIQRAQIDEMAWNTYQPNNGQNSTEDVMGGWKSNAIRPVVRNKCISIAAHATARLLFPKVFAYDKDSQIQKDAAHVMEDLMEWSGEQSNYKMTALSRVTAALIYPASINYTEYSEVYRMVKRVQDDGTYKQVLECDENLSGFQDTPVPVDQLYIENFYESDIQKQGWLIWRRVRSFSLLESVYKAVYPNFAYVNPGVQLIYNDANQTFYQVYDTNMRPEMCEEVIYWNRNLDLKIIMVNGVMLTPADNPNPRLDKLFPFDKFGYSLINSRCFYYKSLAFHLQSDANIVNTLYPMIIDGTYLNIFEPMVNIGGEAIDAPVIVPGAVTTLSSPDAKLQAVKGQANIKDGLATLQTVEESLDSSAVDPISQTDTAPAGTTAYEISRVEQNANTVLGLFIQMISDHVRQYGKLRMGDILQYMTIPEVTEVEDDTELVYKTFLLPNQKSSKGTEDKRIKFDSTLPNEYKDEKHSKELSYDTLEAEGGLERKYTLYRVNPELFRNLKFKVFTSPDVLNPRSEDLERAFKLELYDRAIQNPTLDQDKVTQDFLLGAYKDVADPEKYKVQAQPMVNPLDPTAGGKPQMPNQSPLNSMQNKLPQTMNA